MNDLVEVADDDDIPLKVMEFSLEDGEVIKQLNYSAKPSGKLMALEMIMRLETLLILEISQ